jgi:hypothetical protein
VLAISENHPIWLCQFWEKQREKHDFFSALALLCHSRPSGGENG